MSQPSLTLGENRFALDVEPAIQVTFVTEGARTTAFELVPAGAPAQGRFERTR